MNRIFIGVLVCLISFAFNSCTKAIIDEGEIDELPDLNRKVYYNPDIHNIMFNNCVTCHGGNAPSDGLDLTSYVNVKSAALNRDLKKRMNDANNPMPPSGLLAPEVRQKIDKWIEDGFPESK
jgi:mono/diheme cytochrome c family protein